MVNQNWNSKLRVIANASLNDGDKLILPPSSLENLMNTLQLIQPTPTSSNNHTSPFTFRLLNEKKKVISHAGVREFTAEEGTVELPEWLVTSLDMKVGENVIITAKKLPKGTWGRMRPLTEGYKTIPDFRSAFEANFRAKFTTLTAGEVISIKYGAQLYQFLIEALKPEDAVDIVDTDLELEIVPMNEEGISIDSGSVLKSKSNNSNREISIGSKIGGEIIKGEYKYWKVRAQPSSGINFHLTVFQGDSDIIISNSHEKPTLSDHVWGNFNLGSKCISISSQDPDFVNDGFYYVGVYGYSNETCTFELSIDDQLATTSNGDQMLVDDLDSPYKNAEGYVPCDNCGSWVSERSIQLHRNFCERNNRKCSTCGKVLKRGEEEDSHWHCDLCNQAGDIAQKEKHLYAYHTIRQCTCGNEFQSISELIQHKRNTCPDRLIVCRYCHDLVPYKALSEKANDRLLGLTEHESYCGDRTISCAKCGASVSLKNVQVHGKLHAYMKQNQKLPFILCSNENCVRPRAGSENENRSGVGSNLLKLCQSCFGPFWTPSEDSGNKKLMERIVRKYHSQLTQGCGNSWCRNKYCASSAGRKLDPNEAVATLIPLVPKDINADNQFYFCVDETTSRRRFLLDILLDSPEGKTYRAEYIVKALQVSGEDLDAAKQWLQEHAPHAN
ncbi:hypothetical protein K7432_007414 [Basidiobolus ranarum]|uniref:Uncharacterized protein n=1 Tax=Basidiobolus ranarum TaxID=34480 RepID=A0ABR2WTG6_9FUNG